MRLRDVMLSTVPQISATASVQQALEQIGTAGVPSLIVMDRKQVVGVISAMDLQSVEEGDRCDQRVRSLMRAVTPLAPDVTIKEAANLLRSHNLERVPVTEDGRLVGTVTVGTLLELIGRGAVHAAPNQDRVILAKRGTKRSIEVRQAPQTQGGGKS